MKRRVTKLPWALAVAGVLLAHPTAHAAKPKRSSASDVAKVEMFAAVKAGDLEVKLIPRDAKQATVLLKNKTNRPLHLQLPEAFAGVPVLAQRNIGGNNNNFGGGGGNSNQSFGGGMGGMGMGMGGMGMGMGGMFHVPPAAVRKVKVATVCLEHGKPDPNPKVAYEMKPIEQFTKDRRVFEVCKMLGQGKINQQIAQAAAWHLTDGLTWDALARKVKIRHLNGSTEMYFSPQQVAIAAQLVNVVTAKTGAEEPSSPGEVDTDDPAESLASTRADK